MDIFLNGRLGGTPEIDNLIQPIIINLRKVLKNKFEKAELAEGVSSLDYYLAVNGDLVRYYNRTGIYDVRYSAKKKEIAVTICIDSGEWGKDPKGNQEIFTKLLQDLFNRSGDEIFENLKKKKIVFDLKGFRSCIAAVFEE